MQAPSPPGCKVLWMVVHVMPRQEATEEEGMGSSTEPAPPCTGSSGSVCCWHCPQGWVMGQNQWQCWGCNLCSFPAPAMTAGTRVCFMIGMFASWLGKGRKKSTRVENSRCVHRSPRKPKPVSPIQPLQLPQHRCPPQHPVPADKPCSPLPPISPDLKVLSYIRMEITRLWFWHSPSCLMAAGWHPHWEQCLGT